MKLSIWICGTCIVFVAIGWFQPLGAQPAERRPAAAQTKPAQGAVADPRAAEIAAIRKSAQVFTEAFNRGDAKAVAALWTDDGEYMDADGRRFAGRAAIEKQYAQFFKEHPRAKISVVVDSIRLVGESTAMEDGHAMVELGPTRARGYSQYTAVHSRVGNQWLMSSVRDAPLMPSGADSDLRDLGWLIGSWVAEENGARMDVTCRWIANKNFMERTYSVRRGDEIVASGTQIIGWNAQAGSIQSWTFTSDGGHAVGFWRANPNGWEIETVGMLADGTPTSAINVFTKIDDGAVAWQSVERSAGGQPLPDAEKVLLKRSAVKTK